MREQIKPEIKKSCFDFKASPKVLGVQWEDISSHSRGDTERVPNVFAAKITDDLQICISRGHYFSSNTWTYTCYGLGINDKMLKAETAEDAAIEAIKICKQKAEKWYNAFPENI